MSRVRQIYSKSLSTKEICEQFILQKQAEGVAKRTIEDYKYHINNFFKITNAEIYDYENLDILVKSYFVESAKLAPITFNTRRKILKTFFKWLTVNKYIPQNPMLEIPKRKEDEQPRAIDELTLKDLLTCPNLKTFSGVRDYALIILTMDTGIRPFEATQLTIKEFNLKSFEVFIPAAVAKTRIARTLPLTPITAEAIKNLYAARHPNWNDQIPLFCTENGTLLTRFQWSRRLRQYSEKIGVSVTPYTLRHSFGTIFLRLGGNAFNLQKLMGHTTLTMTRKYIALNQNDLYQQHSIASPVNILVNRKGRVRNINSSR